MKLCASDCVPLCANCKHWLAEDRWGMKTSEPTQDAVCAMGGVTTNTNHKCDRFHCMHSEEE